MKIFLLCGLPAVGKLSVAQELSKLTGFQLFHNHETLDRVEKDFTWGTPDFWEAVMKNRLDSISTAAKLKKSGIILTYVYEGTETDDRYVDGLKNIAQDTGSEIYFIQLTCTVEELKKRVLGASRQEFKKIQSVENLSRFLHISQDSDRLRCDLHIDNTNLSPTEVAQQIQFKFSL